ncbi:peptidoglycan-binding domain-containing protein [Xanthomonas nasturtii]|uniref:peptidoglycan-binding domain-containing protein n=1 Tax=Xanthomonas nasturtii TaxID=1843581 RepID=UPI0020116F77|nr:peptidoglycan-binding domain-containing protein [Xanthomonas nasturtii]MCL1501271.1 peptidoglycan-binding protein [Xanthomonas nasturtii]MCL1505078.1 peptidoglycan-binding protein [Xanthomonas nasturtii]MCL1524729.1 peptidoglycan-binding protein [Xanthomonas nasturtii]
MSGITGWHIGMTSSSYESGGRGGGTISTGKNDHGGVSYGIYQLSTSQGTLQEYLDQSRYGSQFSGLVPKTDAFDEKWRSLASKDPAFAQDQHDFIRETHYDKQVARLSAVGMDLTGRGPAVQDALWSTSVQFRNLTPGIFQKGLSEEFGEGYQLADLSDKQIVEAVQDYKYSHTETLFKKSPGSWNQLRDRALNEKHDLMELAEGRLPTQPSASKHRAGPSSNDGKLEQGERGESVKQLQGQLAQLGATGRDGKPLHPDGDFGANTKHAVKQFQREHGLQVDGVVGRQTQAALGQALSQHTAKQAEQTVAPTAPAQISSPLLSDPRHPDNAMYNGAVSKLEALGERGGFSNRQELQQAAGQIVFEAKVSGLQRIDHVVPNKSGDGFFAVQGEMTDPAMQRVFVDRAQAQNQPLEHSSRQAAEESQRQAQQTQVQEADTRSRTL